MRLTGTFYLATHFLIKSEKSLCGAGGPPMRYDALCQTDYWDDDGTAEWAEMMARCEKDGEVLEFTPRL
eukprot:COSAG03_NODE_6589_length_1035_cov_1.878205_2_plen_69_part_00